MRQAISGSLRLSLLLCLALLAAVIGGGWLLRVSAAAPKPATAPAIQITPNSGKYGTETVVTGQGFAAHEQVAIYRNTRPFFAYNTDANGNFVGVPHPLIGPGPVSGIITITGTGRSSGLKATTTFTVTP
jgi:hypothetical protein